MLFLFFASDAPIGTASIALERALKAAASLPLNRESEHDQKTIWSIVQLTQPLTSEEYEIFLKDIEVHRRFIEILNVWPLGRNPVLPHLNILGLIDLTTAMDFETFQLFVRSRLFHDKPALQLFMNMRGTKKQKLDLLKKIDTFVCGSLLGELCLIEKLIEDLPLNEPIDDNFFALLKLREQHDPSSEADELPDTPKALTLEGAQTFTREQFGANLKMAHTLPFQKN